MPLHKKEDYKCSTFPYILIAMNSIILRTSLPIQLSNPPAKNKKTPLQKEGHF
jgi:hypothetical protein